MSSSPPADFKMSRAEFVALIAMMFSTVAFSMDAILPALPEIGAELSPDDMTRVPLVLSTFFLGLGFGTLVAGPISDSFGRKKVMIAGSILYIISAAVAWQSASLEVMLAARLVQGFGCAGPRIVALAVTRDLFSGREMARIVSFVMIVFALAPGFAPAMAEGIIAISGWRGIYLAFMLFSLITVVWMILRLPETLHPDRRRPLRLPSLWSALKEVFAHPVVRLSITVQTLAMGMLISMLLLIQQVYSVTYGRADSFAYWFGAAALVSASASWLNAMLVVRFGMRRLVTLALAFQVIVTSILLLTGAMGLDEPYGFAFFLLWQVGLFLQSGLTLGNLNAIGMEPMGHIAGMAASVIGGVSTVLAAIIAAPVVVFFDGSPVPLLFYVLVFATIGLIFMARMAQVENRLSDTSPDV